MGFYADAGHSSPLPPAAGATLDKAGGLSSGGRGGNKGSTCLGGVRPSPRPSLARPPAHLRCAAPGHTKPGCSLRAGGFEAETRSCAFSPAAWGAPTRGVCVRRSSRGREWPRPGGETEQACGRRARPGEAACEARARAGRGGRAAETQAGAGGRGRGVCRTLDRSCEPPPRRAAPSPGAAARIAEGLGRSGCICRGSLPAGKPAPTGAVRAAGFGVLLRRPLRRSPGAAVEARTGARWGRSPGGFRPRRCGRRGAARSPARG